MASGRCSPLALGLPTCEADFPGKSSRPSPSAPPEPPWAFWLPTSCTRTLAVVLLLTSDTLDTPVEAWPHRSRVADEHVMMGARRRRVSGRTPPTRAALAPRARPLTVLMGCSDPTQLLGRTVEFFNSMLTTAAGSMMLDVTLAARRLRPRWSQRMSNIPLESIFQTLSNPPGLNQ